MRELAELINRDDPAWPIVKQWVSEATNPVEVLPAPNPEIRGAALVQTQVTTRSPMGAIIYKSGGLLIDHGWLRILGSGHPRLPRTLPDWNQGRTMAAPGESPPFLLVADDVVGGSFAIDGGGLGLETGKVCYFAQDRLEWENTGLGYSDFIRWSLFGNITGFYEDLRWPGWEDEVRSVAGDQAFSIYPFLWAQGPPLAERSRRPVPMAEIYDMLGPGSPWPRRLKQMQPALRGGSAADSATVGMRRRLAPLPQVRTEIPKPGTNRELKPLRLWPR